MGMSLTSVLSSIRTFGGAERTVFLREQSSGISCVAYFAGKALADVPYNVAAPFFFLSLFYRLGLPLASFNSLYFTAAGAQAAGCGLGYLVSALVPVANQQVAGVVVVLIMSLLSGDKPPLAVLNSNPVTAALVLVALNPWSMGCFVIKYAPLLSIICPICSARSCSQYVPPRNS